MLFSFRDASELHRLISDTAQPVMLIVGAWVSTQAPSSIPDAWRWKRALISSLSEASGWPTESFYTDLSERLSDLRTSQDLKLERVLEGIESTRRGASSALVKSVAAGSPNAVHRYIAACLDSRAVSGVVCLNFDELIQAAEPGRFTTWNTGEACSPADIYHVHGSASRPDSLRHVLSRFNLRLPHAEHDMIVDALSGDVVALGWAASDPDVLSTLREGTGTLHVLIAGDHPDPTTERDLTSIADRRRVVFYRGGFERLAFGGGPGFRYPDDASFEGARRKIQEIVEGIPLSAARRAFAALSYEHAIGNRRFENHRELLTRWSRLGSTDVERDLIDRSVAELLQATGRPGKAGWINVKLYRRDRDPYLLSEAGDAWERTLRGFNPFGRVTGLLLHSKAIRRYREVGIVAPRWVSVRLARALMWVGRTRRAGSLLDKALNESEDDSNLWERAHCHRLRALARARGGDTRWTDDIELAKTLFTFAGRTLEVGSVHRSAALCEMLMGQAGWRDRAVDELNFADEAYRAARDHSADARLSVQRLVTRAAPRQLGAFALMHL
ncbi:hypothetical protein [Microbacterium sp. A1-JK]|uniref:hypothetical protein n=1 Tax=Microbacterium sp. A1-JK TaxID=3177516 RepID=UPI003888EA87